MEEIKSKDREAYEQAEGELPEYCARNGEAGGCSYAGKCAAVLCASQSDALARIVGDEWVPSDERKYRSAQLRTAISCATKNQASKAEGGADIGRAWVRITRG